MTSGISDVWQCSCKEVYSKRKFCFFFCFCSKAHFAFAQRHILLLLKCTFCFCSKAHFAFAQRHILKGTFCFCSNAYFAFAQRYILLLLKGTFCFCSKGTFSLDAARLSKIKMCGFTSPRHAQSLIRAFSLIEIFYSIQ